MEKAAATKMVHEMVDLNSRGEYGGRAAQIKRELANNVLVAGWSSSGNTLYRKSNGRKTVDFEAAVESYR